MINCFSALLYKCPDDCPPWTYIFSIKWETFRVVLSHKSESVWIFRMGQLSKFEPSVDGESKSQESFVRLALWISIKFRYGLRQIVITGITSFDWMGSRGLSWNKEEQKWRILRDKRHSKLYIVAVAVLASKNFSTHSQTWAIKPARQRRGKIHPVHIQTIP